MIQRGGSVGLTGGGRRVRDVGSAREQTLCLSNISNKLSRVFQKTLITVAKLPSYKIVYIKYTCRIPKKTDLFDIIWKYVDLKKIFIKNGQINNKKIVESLNGHKTST